MDITKNTNIQQKHCLATVSTKEYWAGTLTMIKSFLKYNKWFTGDLIVISDENLPNQKSICNVPIKFKEPSDQLKNAVKNLCQEVPLINSIQSRLLLLEIFNIQGYSNIMYADSDVLFGGSVKQLFLNNGLSAVRDPAHFRGYCRKRQTFERFPIERFNEKECFKRFFNSGILVLNESLVSDSIYRDLLMKVNPETYLNLKDILADEPILNQQFEKDFIELDASFNSPVHLLIDNTLKNTPVVIHFTGIHKPWKLLSWINLNLRSVKYSKYLIKWLKIHCKG